MDPRPDNVHTPPPLDALRGFVGGDLSRTHFVSPFGVLLKLSRLNHFSRHEFFSQFGLRLKASEDLSKVLAFSAKRLDAFSRSLGIAPNRPGWRLEHWWPFQAASFDPAEPWLLRICPQCAHLGYHTWLFQVPWIETCRWHGTALLSRCRNCYRPLLHGGQPPRPLLACVCGVDWFSTHAALRSDRMDHSARDRCLGDYLDWAAWSRSDRTVLLPELHRHAPHVFDALLDLPRELGGTGRLAACGTHVFHRYKHLHPGHGAQGELSVWWESFSDHIDGMIDLPASLIPAMRAVAWHVATHLPPGALLPAEAEGLIPTGLLPHSNSHDGRVDILYLPVQEIGGRAFVAASGLPKVPLAMIGSLLRATREYWGDLGSAELVIRAARALLLRAYADGLRIVLGKHIPELYSDPRLKPCVKVPWLRYSHDAVGISDIRIAWSTWNADEVDELRDAAQWGASGANG